LHTLPTVLDMLRQKFQSVAIEGQAVIRNIDRNTTDEVYHHVNKNIITEHRIHIVVE
jgi:hypothetical protein